MSDVTSTPSRPGSPSASVLAANDIPTARPYRFVWDPSSRRPGPESVAGTTEGGRGAGDYILGNVQPLGVLNNPSSLNFALGTLPSEWSSSKHGFHAISTVLNNPHKKQAPPKPHSSLPSVPPADLPRVRRKDFDSYLKAITPEWEKYERNSQLGRQGQAQIDASRFAGEFGESEQSDDDDEEHNHNNAPSRSNPISSIQGREIPPLNSVPGVFFDQNFNLAEPTTFAAVTEQSLLDPRTPTQSSTPSDDADTDPLLISHSLPLLEKFSHYADTVEQHLIREIAIRSTSFFAALTNLRDLQTSSTECLARIQDLREKLKLVDEGTAKKGLELVTGRRKEHRLQEVRNGVKMIGGVVEMAGVAKGLVSAGQWGEALEVIEEVDGMWEGVQAQEQNVNGSAAPNGGLLKLETTVEEQEEGEEDTTSTAHTAVAADGENPLSSSVDGKYTQDNGWAKRTSPPIPPNIIPLASLTAFSSLPSHLRSLTMEIAASLSAELVAILKDDWLSHVEAREGTETVQNGRKDELKDQGFKDRLKPLLLNLVRTKGLKEAMLSWREIVIGEVNGLVKKKLPGIDDDDGDAANGLNGASSEARAGLANHLRNMSQAEFMVLLQDLYGRFLTGLERLKSQGEIIIGLLLTLKPEQPHRLKHRLPATPSSSSPLTTTSSTSKDSPGSHTTFIPIPAIEEDLADILSSACNLANTQAARVISFRSEQHSHLEFPEFLMFFNESWAFLLRCEVLSRRMIVGLRGTALSQAKVWLQTFHQARITRSAKLVEDEVWNPADVTKELQRVANVIMDSAVRDSPELLISPKKDEEKKAGSPNGLDETNQEGSASPVANSIAEPPSALPTAASATSSHGRPSSSKHLRIEERSYYVVPATAEVLVLLLDYLRVIVNLNMLTTESMSRVIEFLKAFNSRTCQVVLGAGAMRSAGLKNITAKHLALASQSLSIVFELIPYVRETFRRHLNQKQAVMLVEFDKLKRDYQEHQNEIHAKLIVIMGDRLTAHIKTLQAVDWNQEREAGTVNDYMLHLVKETVTLNKVLSRYLPAPIVEFVMSEVLAAINHRLSEEYGKIDLPHQQAKNLLLDDARYLRQNFSALKNVRAPTGMLEMVVAEKNLPRPNPPMPTRSNTFSANQRLKGLLSGRTSLVDKALPNPGRAPTPPAPIGDSRPSLNSSSSSLQGLSAATMASGGNSLSNLGIEAAMSGSNISLAMSPPIDESGPGRFGSLRSMDVPMSGAQDEPRQNHRPETHPPATNGSSPPLPSKSEYAPEQANRGSDASQGTSS